MLAGSARRACKRRRCVVVIRGWEERIGGREMILKYREKEGSKRVR